MTRLPSPAEIINNLRQPEVATDIDHVKMWMTECTTEGQTYTGILYASYQRWLEKRQVEPLTLLEFGMALRLLNVERLRNRRGSLVSLKLKPAPRLQPTRPAPATGAIVKSRLGLR